jgi:hypothetical protein
MIAPPVLAQRTVGDVAELVVGARNSNPRKVRVARNKLILIFPFLKVEADAMGIHTVICVVTRGQVLIRPSFDTGLQPLSSVLAPLR